MICSQNDIKFYKDFQLTNFNTLKIKSTAKLFYMPDNYGEMITIFKRTKDKTPIVIGNGSNVLFSSQGIEEPIIHTGLIKSVLALGQTLEVEAGIKTQTLAKYAYDKKLSGFEFGCFDCVFVCVFRVDSEIGVENFVNRFDFSSWVT